MTAIRRTFALVAVLALVLAACGGDPAVDVDVVEETPTPTDQDAVDGDDPADTPADPGTRPADGEPGASAVVAVGSTDLGEVLVDGDGLTLYLFEPDEQSQPTCYDDCAAAWPPLLTDGEPVASEGADEALLGTAQRDDGTTQVTYDGWPLYRWAGDAAPGDTNGQGINDVWWVVTPDGTPKQAAAATDSGSEDGVGARDY